MQHSSRVKNSTAANVVLGSGWTLGLLLAGSDGPFMPWGNILGVLLFACASLCMAGIRPAVRFKNVKSRLGSARRTRGNTEGGRLQPGTSGA